MRILAPPDGSAGAAAALDKLLSTFLLQSPSSRTFETRASVASTAKTRSGRRSIGRCGGPTIHRSYRATP